MHFICVDVLRRVKLQDKTNQMFFINRAWEILMRFSKSQLHYETETQYFVLLVEMSKIRPGEISHSV